MFRNLGISHYRETSRKMTLLGKLFGFVFMSFISTLLSLMFLENIAVAFLSHGF